MKYFLMMIFIFPFALNLFAQDIKIFGEAKPSAILIGKADSAVSVIFNTKQIQIDENGVFVFGFDRDDSGKFELAVNFNNGKSETIFFDIAKRDYKVQHIKQMAQKYVTPPKEVTERIERESKIMKSARASVGEIDSAYFSTGFSKPVKKARLTSVFGSQRILNDVPKAPHNGIDYAAPIGTPIYAAASGIVKLAGDNFYYNGNFVLLDHGQGLSSIYIHMNKNFVKDGEFVEKGQKIGEIGNTGRSTGPHLHWGVQWHDKRIDPLLLLEVKIDDELAKK